MIRLATSAAQPMKVFPSREALAKHIHKWRAGRGLKLVEIQLAHPSSKEPEPAVGVHALDADGERCDQLGYVLMDCAAGVARMRLGEALLALAPELERVAA